MTVTAIATAEPDDWSDLEERFMAIQASGMRLLSEMATIYDALRKRRARFVDTGEHMIAELEQKLADVQEAAGGDAA